MSEKRHETHEDVYEIWDALSDYDAAQIDAALRMLMTRLCEMSGADNAMWVGSVRVSPDADDEQRLRQHGWRARAIAHLHADAERYATTRKAIREQDGPLYSMTIEALTAGAGHYRSHLLHDGFIDFERYAQSHEYEWLCKGMGITDRMWIAFPVNADAESYFVLDVVDRRRRFTDDDQQRAMQVLRGIKWFHRRLLLSHGLLIAEKALTPQERRIAHALLGDMAEKQIAVDLGLASTTLHSYVKTLYRHFGVRGRTGLHALWHGTFTPQHAARLKSAALKRA